jgi:hypothetical protein
LASRASSTRAKWSSRPTRSSARVSSILSSIYLDGPVQCRMRTHIV